MASAHQGTEYAQVGDRELQATTDTKVGTRTTAMEVHVGLGRLRTARVAWSENRQN